VSPRRWINIEGLLPKSHLFLVWITLILRQWEQLGVVVLIFGVLTVFLYFGWYRYLGKEVKTEEVVEL